MTSHNELRLLPWPGAEGKPCFLSTDDSGSHLSRLADNIEAMQLGIAAELLEHAWEVLGDEETDPEELRLLAMDLTEVLHDALRVATSRGYRPAGPPSSSRDGGDDGSPPPAAISG
ncbi:hypothetical protein RCO28_29880 [Streptomyces sp. LHD-70]|uniref:hypothetical protein n=1 Tax=Streptomyces sp. LHD-70 TaxID=3072140 RepID=UPI00281081DD|nr:hypothetical protein [Streptomyces sp. LHD-70]MDQ8706652.1 hypothetical protein [Streptomyces sp. LHD-70]